MTLGGAARAGVRLVVWCRDCNRQVEPDAAAMAERATERRRRSSIGTLALSAARAERRTSTLC
jgi:hypothetical protein